MKHEDLLNASDTWLKYAIRLNLCREPKEALAGLREEALSDNLIRGFLNDVAHFHSVAVTNHKNPELPVHKLLFLLDLGFDMDVPEIRAAVGGILGHKDAHGVYQSLVNIPVHFGGTGKDAFGWSLCDAPLLLRALLEAGVDYREHLKPGVDVLAALGRGNGFPCAASRELGKFRGPGRKEDCCPYATLAMANLLAAIPEYRDSPAAAASAEALLALWEHSREQHPYIFYMGDDFRKLKAPPLWYDILSVVSALSRYPRVHDDRRFQEMIGIVAGKRDSKGFFTPESVYQKMKSWDFGQKKAPSPYLTYLCRKVFERLPSQGTQWFAGPGMERP